MREILFRGQTRRYGEKVWMNGEKVPSQWVCGGVLQGIGDFSIIYGYDNPEMKDEIQKWTVYTDTLGQYTGLTDKNGKRIFEGDIIQARRIEGGSLISGFVNFMNGCFCVRYFGNNPAIDLLKEYKIIGNIHDNPEMIGGKEDGK